MTDLIDSIADLSVSPEAVREYEDQMLRWLTAKREYPWMTEPEPMPNNFALIYLHRDRIVREFERRA